MQVVLRYPGPVAAPVAIGDKVGDIVIRIPGRPEQAIPLTAAAPVSELGAISRAKAALDYLLFGPGS